MNNLKTKALGDLKIDKVLFESYYPILFTCVDEQQVLFLCVCCQANNQGKKWLITKTTPSIVISILENQITMREAFLKFPELQITIIHGEEILEKQNDKSDWDYENSVSLPDKGEYIDAEAGEFDEEIAYYEEQGILAEKNEYSNLDEEFKSMVTWINYSDEQLKSADISISEEVTIPVSQEIILMNSEMLKVILDMRINEVGYNDSYKLEKSQKYELNLQEMSWEGSGKLLDAA